MKVPALWLAVLLALLLVAGLFSLGVGAVPIPASRVVQILWDARGSAASVSDTAIVWELRLPRILLACLVGAGLGAAGAGYQGLFRNPLADPFVIGASSGAALGATLVIVTGFQVSTLGVGWAQGSVQIAALAGSLLAVALVHTIASVGRQVSLTSLLLAGVATSSFLGAVVSLLMFLNHEQLVTIFGWLMGSLSGRGWPMFWAATLPVAAGCVTLWCASRVLDALTFGEDTALSIGVNLGRLRGVVIVAASLATAAGVAAVGVIGFVGLISPHLARMLVGARHIYVIPASGLSGALLLLLADDIARTVTAPAELPVGVVTALLGSPFFLVLLKARK